MTTEKDFLTKIADIILSTIESKDINLRKGEFYTMGHFSPKTLNRQNLFSMKSTTMARLFLYMAIVLSQEKLHDLFKALYEYILYVGELEDYSAEAIMESHAKTIQL